MIPKIHFSEAEFVQQKMAKKTLITMFKAFEGNGCLHIENAYKQEEIQKLERLFKKGYKSFYQDREYYNNALKVGDKRWMVTLKWKGAWLQSKLFNHPLLSTFIQEVLGQEYILGSAGVVVAQPGAKQQHSHRDLPALFDDHPIDPQLPCYAVTMFVPLLDFNEEFGATEMSLGSHKVLSEQAQEIDGTRPEAHLGSCFLMDYRLQHRGTANHSQQTRPLFYQVYTKPWFRDYRNFKKQPMLSITHKSYNSLSRENRRLFQFAKRSWL